MNAFESGARKAIPAVLVYARRVDSVLMIHRNAAPGDFHSGKWNGLGGKCELDESPIEAARRELREESGLDLPTEAFQPLGVLQFPNFKPHKAEDWLVFVFSADANGATGELDRCEEGELHWVAARDLLALNLWPGDKYFIPYVTSRSPFVGTLWYSGGEVTRHWIQELGK